MYGNSGRLLHRHKSPVLFAETRTLLLSEQRFRGGRQGAHSNFPNRKGGSERRLFASVIQFIRPHPRLVYWLAVISARVSDTRVCIYYILSALCGNAPKFRFKFPTLGIIPPVRVNAQTDTFSNCHAAINNIIIVCVEYTYYPITLLMMWHLSPAWYVW